MNKDVKEIKNDLDFARDLFDYTLNPNQCGLLLDYTNQLETSIATKDSELLQLKEELRQLKTNRDELKKWLRVCLEENNKIRLYDNNSYQAGEINTLENVIDKMQELERDKE